MSTNDKDHRVNDRAALTLCMIVKNEERFLADCLRSVQGCLDEIIVVDTGSTDRTPEIAASFGARIYAHPWENDFSKHRNQSLQYARGEWILWMDADEALEPGGGSVIRNAIASEGTDSLMATMVCYFGNRTRESWNNAVKLFRNGVGIHFEGAVHNQVVGCRNTGFCPVKIYHYGYDAGPQAVRRKFERTSALLKKAIQDNPRDFRHHHDLAVSCASVRLHCKAIEEGLTAIRLYHENGNRDPNILWTHFVIASSCFNLGRMGQAREVSEAALRIQPDHLDSYFVLAAVCAAENDRNGFESAYSTYTDLCREFRENPESLAGLVVNKGSEKWRLDLEYASLLLREGHEDSAADLFTKVASECPDPEYACTAAIHAFRQAGRFALAERFLKAAEQRGTDPRQMAFEGAILDRLSGTRSAYLKKMEDLLQPRPGDTPEFLAALGMEGLKIPKYEQSESLLNEAVKGGYETPAVFTSLALACKYQGKVVQAREWNLKAIEMDPMDTRACVNLGHLSYELRDWQEARSWYSRAMEMDGFQKDVLLRLSLISLIDQDLPACVDYCDRLSQVLGIPLDMEIGSAKDLAVVYNAVADAFLKAGHTGLHEETAAFANALRIH